MSCIANNKLLNVSLKITAQTNQIPFALTAKKGQRCHKPNGLLVSFKIETAKY